MWTARIIFAIKMYNFLLILWFSKDDSFTNNEKLVCMYSDRK